MPLPSIHPALINSANPWVTTEEDLQALFDCPFTGAVTTRTCLLEAFQHDPSVHQYTFFDTHSFLAKQANSNGESPDSFSGSLNTLGYSPIPLATYLAMINRIIVDSTLPYAVRRTKPIIISVTGSSKAVFECYQMIQAEQANTSIPLCMEINLSCPNIPDKPPPAYSASSLAEYLQVIGSAVTPSNQQKVAVGIKTPPYTYHDQFQVLIDSLLATSTTRCSVDFVTATNTLGSSLVLADTTGTPVLSSASGTGIGGLAGAPLHALALGNVKTIRTMLDRHEKLRSIDIIGVGGVGDQEGFDRMRAVGATVVGVGTALGKQGVEVFGRIVNGVEKSMG